MDKETRKLVEQQIKLLSDKSNEPLLVEEIVELSKAMAQLISVLNEF